MKTILLKAQERRKNIKDFVEERLTAVKKGKMSSESLYRNYLDFCTEKGSRPTSKIGLCREVVKFIGHCRWCVNEKGMFRGYRVERKTWGSWG